MAVDATLVTFDEDIPDDLCVSSGNTGMHQRLFHERLQFLERDPRTIVILLGIRIHILHSVLLLHLCSCYDYLKILRDLHLFHQISSHLVGDQCIDQVQGDRLEIRNHPNLVA
ncbi:hypothetical protein SDC9_193433 [bioreactor metagenome]|uniref:Uncharacterized protein n=1 Tax=bioreactor metagenome TaxID=1076179 RepID=A0A645I3M7_9ZZZZ